RHHDEDQQHRPPPPHHCPPGAPQPRHERCPPRSQQQLWAECGFRDEGRTQAPPGIESRLCNAPHTALTFECASVPRLRHGLPVVVTTHVVILAFYSSRRPGSV